MRMATALAFRDELEKQALLGSATSALWKSSLGRTAAGSAVGAGVGALTSPDDRKGGAIRGGLLGAGAGLAAPLLTRSGRAGAGKWASGVYQQQKYAITGKGVNPAERKLADAVSKAKAAPLEEPGRMARLRGRSSGDVRAAGIASAEKEQGRYLAANKAGLTNVPGLYRAVKSDPAATLKAGWKSMGGLDKAMIVGFTGMEGANLVNKNTEEGAGEKAGRMAVGTPAWMLTSRMGFVPAMVGMMGGSALGGYAGRGIDKLRGYKPPDQRQLAPPPRQLAPAPVE